jgi:hypothetical protein
MRIKLVISAVAGLAASTAMAQDYYNQGAFQAAATGGGNGQTWLEDFEYPTISTLTILTDPLTQGVSNGAFTSGTLGPLALQSNTTNGNSPSPRGGGQPMVGWQGGIGYTATDAVTTNYFVDGMDVIMLGTDVTAIGFNPICYSGGDTVTIKLFDLANNPLGTFSSPASNAEKDFFGFVSNTPIGRVNILGGFNAEGADNIELWARVPAPGATALLGLGGLIAGRRRRA